MLESRYNVWAYLDSADCVFNIGVLVIRPARRVTKTVRFAW